MDIKLWTWYYLLMYILFILLSLSVCDKIMNIDLFLFWGNMIQCNACVLIKNIYSYFKKQCVHYFNNKNSSFFNKQQLWPISKLISN